MTSIEETPARVVRYELRVDIDAPRPRVWKALTEEIDKWWLPDFHVVGEDSTVTLEPRAGGRFIEERPDGSSLLWHTVIWVSPGESLRLVGHAFPEWGGPSTSTITFTLEERGEDGCTVKISDAIFGHITDENVTSLHDGWKQLFTEGLKRHVEDGASRS